MRYDLTHTSLYEYTSSVSLSHHMLRLQPRELERQNCLTSELAISPAPGIIKSHFDYFGNKMIFVSVEGSHKKLVITARSRVEVRLPNLPPPEETIPWEMARDLCRADQPNGTLAAREFIHPSPQIKLLPEFQAYALPSFTPGRPLLAAASDLTARIHREFKFDAKATTITTPLAEVFKLRRGVCQDFAHLEIACLRSLGLPARYVSGYLETDPPPGKPRLTGADASHAWVSVYCGAAGWVDLDPTNNVLPTNRHITLAWGRDYSDVSPVRGVILGSGEHSIKVSVDVIPQTEPQLAL